MAVFTQTRQQTEPVRGGKRSPSFLPPGTRRHVLDLDDFSREEIELVLREAEALKEVLAREVKKVPALRSKSVVNLFFEPSTRTRVSFEQAARALTAAVG